MRAARELSGHCLVAGSARGKSVVLDDPLSLWGGFDPESGRVIDVHHPQHGIMIAGRIVFMPGGRGSSSSASVLLESVRLGHHPLALVLAEPDPVLVIGALVAADLYGVAVPIVRVATADLEAIAAGATVHVDATRNGAQIVIA
jgi:predicted aconitase with swiveling domain